jgi:hypothetical protein
MVVKIPLKKSCSLSKHGYALSASTRQRHKALAAAIADYGSSYVIKKLNVLAIYRKNNPKLKDDVKTLHQDIAYVQKVRDALSKTERAQNLILARVHTH